MGNIIKADDTSLERFKKQFESAADEYATNLKKLDQLVDGITRGQYTGTTATKFKQDYDTQKPTFEKITTTLQDVSIAIGKKNKEFDSLVNELSH